MMPYYCVCVGLFATNTHLHTYLFMCTAGFVARIKLSVILLECYFALSFSLFSGACMCTTDSTDDLKDACGSSLAV